MPKQLEAKYALEAKIRDCWNVVGDIKVLSEAYQDKNLTPDQVANILIGIEQLYTLKFENLFAQYEKMVESKNII